MIRVHNFYILILLSCFVIKASQASKDEAELGSRASANVPNVKKTIIFSFDTPLGYDEDYTDGTNEESDPESGTDEREYAGDKSNNEDNSRFNQILNEMWTER